MLGNDVVDLLDPDIRPEHLHPRFDARVFSPDEREAIAGAVDPVRQRWALWAAKEAAYKAARRCDASVVFSPIRFRVVVSGETGRVTHESGAWSVRYLGDERAVHAVASRVGSHGGALRTLHGWRRGPAADPSAAVREFLCAELSGQLGLAQAELSVQRRERVPELWMCGEPLPGVLSLSHHGSLVAYAFRLHDAPAALGGLAA